MTFDLSIWYGFILTYLSQIRKSRSQVRAQGRMSTTFLFRPKVKTGLKFQVNVMNRKMVGATLSHAAAMRAIATISVSTFLLATNRFGLYSAMGWLCLSVILFVCPNDNVRTKYVLVSSAPECPTRRTRVVKYSLESTDPRESKIRAPPQLTIALKLSYYLFIIAKLFKVKDG